MTNEQELILLHSALRAHGIRAYARKDRSNEVVSIDLRRAAADPQANAAFERLAASGGR